MSNTFHTVANAIEALSRDTTSKEYKSAVRKMKSVARKLSEGDWCTVDIHDLYTYASAVSCAFDEEVKYMKENGI